MWQRQGVSCNARPRPRRGIARAVLGSIVALTLLAPAPATARHRHHHRHHHHHARHRAVPAPVFEWIVLDAESGRVLGQQNADEETYPASLTKMMTLYLTFEALNQGRISLDQRFRVSPHAAGRAPSKLGLKAGDAVTVRNLILAIVTKSANDAAVVLAEGLAGSEADFARDMTRTARRLGMDHTWYDNASGLPDPRQRTTARDVARLALALYHRFPREYRYFDTREFDFRGDIVHGHNHLLDWYPGADGIKTGFITASGFNLAASAVRGGHRLIAVIMGGRTARIRDMQMASLLDQGFAMLAAGRPAPGAGATVVAAAPAPAAAAPPPARPSPAVADARRPSRSLDHVARAALQHLAPVGRAEAAPLVHQRGGRKHDWAIQVGAFRAATAAAHAVRHVARLAVARGKPRQVVAPPKGEQPRLYRARLLHFTQRGAQAACAELHRRGIACAVVHASGRA